MFSAPYTSLVCIRSLKYSLVIFTLFFSHISPLSIHMGRKPGFLPLLPRLGSCSILSSELHMCNLFPFLHTQKPSARIVLDYVVHSFVFLPLLFCINYILLLFLFTREEKSPLDLITVIPISSHSLSRCGLSPLPGPEYHFAK